MLIYLLVVSGLLLSVGRIGDLRGHKKDFSSRRGLIKKVGERRRLMKYLKREDAKAYDDLMTKLKI